MNFIQTQLLASRRYAYAWAPQTDILESWIRLETAGSTGAAKQQRGGGGAAEGREEELELEE